MYKRERETENVRESRMRVELVIWSETEDDQKSRCQQAGSQRITKRMTYLPQLMMLTGPLVVLEPVCKCMPMISLLPGKVASKLSLAEMAKPIPSEVAASTTAYEPPNTRKERQSADRDENMIR